MGARDEGFRAISWAILIGAAVLGLGWFGAQFLFPGCIASPKATTLSSLKQVAIGVQIYAEDFDDRFPPDMSTARGASHYIETHLKNLSVISSANPKSPEILGNNTLASQKQSEVLNAERTLEFFDSAPWKEGQRCVVFADSHVKRIKEEDFQQALVNSWHLKK